MAGRRRWWHSGDGRDEIADRSCTHRDQCCVHELGGSTIEFPPGGWAVRKLLRCSRLGVEVSRRYRGVTAVSRCQPNRGILNRPDSPQGGSHGVGGETAVSLDGSGGGGADASPAHHHRGVGAQPAGVQVAGINGGERPRWGDQLPHGVVAPAFHGAAGAHAAGMVATDGYRFEQPRGHVSDVRLVPAGVLAEGEPATVGIAPARDGADDEDATRVEAVCETLSSSAGFGGVCAVFEHATAASPAASVTIPHSLVCPAVRAHCRRAVEPPRRWC